MISYKDILELEDKVDDLKRKIRSLEREESDYESELSGARTRSNVGLTTMPLNLTVGLSLKMIADTDVSRINGKLGEVRGNITATKSYVTTLEREIEELKKKWKAERKEAELIIEKDSIYINGDDKKRDLLANAKKYRKEAEEQLKSINTNTRVNSYLQAQKEFKEVLGKSIYETYDIYKSSKSKYSDLVKKVSNYTDTNGVEEIEGYMVPKETFPSYARDFIGREIAHREKLIENINYEFDNMKPTFIQRIFPSSFKKQKSQMKINNQYRIDRYLSEIKERKEALSTLDDLEKTFYAPYEQIKPVVSKYQKANKDLIDNGEKHLIAKKVELEKKLAQNDCIPAVSSIIPEDIKHYLLETNQSVSTLSLRKALSTMKDLEPGVLTDLQMVLATRETQAYEPTPRRGFR